MNANAIRVHSHVAGRALYDVADEMGLMIWQDVPLQWGYNNSDAFADNAARQTREMVEQFGNSPAIIVWGGHNEPPWNSPWMEKRFPDWNKNLNQTLTKRVGDALSQDTSRIVHRFSAVEEHYWAGWYFGTMRDLLGRQNRDHHGVWRSGATATLNPENHHSRPPDVAEKHRRRRSRLDALEIP